MRTLLFLVSCVQSTVRTQKFFGIARCEKRFPFRSTTWGAAAWTNLPEIVFHRISWVVPHVFWNIVLFLFSIIVIRYCWIDWTLTQYREKAPKSLSNQNQSAFYWNTTANLITASDFPKSRGWGKLNESQISTTWPMELHRTLLEMVYNGPAATNRALVFGILCHCCRGKRTTTSQGTRCELYEDKKTWDQRVTSLIHRLGSRQIVTGYISPPILWEPLCDQDHRLISPIILILYELTTSANFPTARCLRYLSIGIWNTGLNCLNLFRFSSFFKDWILGPIQTILRETDS